MKSPYANRLWFSVTDRPPKSGLADEGRDEGGDQVPDQRRHDGGERYPDHDPDRRVGSGCPAAGIA
jgi:hypothetical protein